MDIDLLRLITDKDKFVRFQPHIKEHVLGKEALTIFHSIENYYKSYPHATSINWADFESFFFVLRNSSLTKQEIPLYKSIFKNLSTPTTSSVVLEDLLKHYITEDYLTRIANRALGVGSGKTGSKVDAIDDIAELVKQHDKEVSRSISKTDLFTDFDVSAVSRTLASGGYEWRLEELNVSVGPLRRGNFVIVGARPEVGKTTFLASEVTHFASQIRNDQCVLWVNNEQPADEVTFRIVQAALGWTTADILADEAAAMAEYTRIMNGDKHRIHVVRDDAGLNNVKSLNALMKDLNPAMVVFDQLDKVEGFSKAERDDLRLGQIYLWARRVALEYGVVLAASQVDASAEGMQWVTQDKLRGSKTDKPGEADVILTIGKDASGTSERCLSVCKNKCFGGSRTIPSARHGKYSVEILPEIARFKGVL